MAIILTKHAVEESTFVIEISFYDEEDNAVNPVTANWTLTDMDGTVINSRSAVTISTPSSTENIVLSGDDLPAQSDGRPLVLTIQGTYDSDNGTGLPFNHEIRFYVDDLIKVT